MVAEPSTNGSNGRDAAGRFVEGNVGGPGNPHAKRVAQLRSAMLNAVSQDDLREILGKLVELAKAGSIPAAREVLDRCLGRNMSLDGLTSWTDDIERDAKYALQHAELEASNQPEVLAKQIADLFGIDQAEILRFVSRGPEVDQQNLAERLAQSSGVEYGQLADFLNGKLDELRKAYDARQAQGARNGGRG